MKDFKQPEFLYYKLESKDQTLFDTINKTYIDDNGKEQKNKVPKDAVELSEKDYEKEIAELEDLTSDTDNQEKVTKAYKALSKLDKDTADALADLFGWSV